MDKSPDAFRTISEVAEWLDVPTHVLRFWESRFTQIKPVKRAGGRRYYRPSDMELLGGIKRLLHEDGLTIRGVQKILREQGPKHVATLASSADTTSGVHDPEGSPMAVDVPADPPAGEIVPFNATTTVTASTGPDDALNRWPFADDPQDAAEQGNPEPTSAPSMQGGDETTLDLEEKTLATKGLDKPATAPETDAPAVGTAGGLTDPSHTGMSASESSGSDIAKDTDQAISPEGPAIGTAALCGKIAALPAGKLNARASDLLPLIDRMERLRTRLSGHATPDAD